MRIVGGQWRSRLLPVAGLASVRPTPDRVRETLFNWLGQDLRGMRCLDLFAGSGILGLEAASRGATQVTLVERDAAAHATLRETIKTLQATQVELIRGDALEFARRCKQPHNVVFLDPPYHQGWLEKLLPWLDALVEPEGWLYVEAEYPVASLGHWHAVRSGKAGQVCFQLMRGSDP